MTIDMNYGAGGKKSNQLIENLFLKAFDNVYLNQKNDQAELPAINGRIVVSTDGHVVSPLFFPGGDIGKLAVYGTINDVATSGAIPLYLTTSFIIEEGFLLSELEKIVYSCAAAAKECNVPIVTGDTKVVERGKGDGVFITTTGIGVIKNPKINISAHRATPGDKILINGYIGDHGIALMSKREKLDFQTEMCSDLAPLHTLVQDILKADNDIHCLRDPTRGGLASILNELACTSNTGMTIYEEKIPIKDVVHSACELLGLDPLFVANEGKMVVICQKDSAQEVLSAMKEHPLGRNSAIIGEVNFDPDNLVQAITSFGGPRLITWATHEQLPRIC